jgi:alkanesulfonate monooxygenase
MDHLMLERKPFMKIAVLCNTGPHGWLQSGAKAEGDMDFELYRHLAQTCERGKLDVMFLGDGVGVKTLGLTPDELAMVGNLAHFEPMTLLSALSQVTQHVGLFATISATYAHPFAIARQVGSLDFLSKGRAGWNVVTSNSNEEAANFGYMEQLSSSARYRRANEAVDAVFGLWDSFEDGAFLRDRQSRNYLDPAKMHSLDFEGEFFKIKGPLNLPRPLQGRPVIAQAGRSQEGHEMAARTADIMYATYSTLEGGRAFQRRMHDAMAKYGRRPGELAVLPGYFPVIGGTEAEANRKFADLQDLIDEQAGLNLIKSFWGLDLNGHNVDSALPELPDSVARGHGEALQLTRRGRRITVKEAYNWLSSAYGHLSLIGTPEQVADSMQLWFEQGGADGFNLFLHSMPGSLDDFVNEVVPILQKRGLMKTEYVDGTLRDKLGLPRPGSRYARG